MRRAFMLTLVIACAAFAHAQGGNTLIIRFAGAPSGSCAPFMIGINNATGALYDCVAGVWTLVGGGGGGAGTVTNVLGTANQIVSDGNTATPTLSLSPTIILPGTINKYTFTAPATAATFAIANNKSVAINNSLTLAGTDSTTQTFAGISGNPWSVISATVGNTDLVNCPNNTTSNFATTYTIPANYLVANKILRVTLLFLMTTSGTPPSMSVNLTIGGTAVFTSVTSAPVASMTTVPEGVTFYIQGSAAAGASAAVYTHPVLVTQSSSGVNPFRTGPTGVAQPVNLATNGTLVIQPILACSLNTAGNSMTLQQFIVESD